MKRVTIVAALFVALTVSAVAHAITNNFTTRQLVNQMFVIDTNVGPVCQFALADNTLWAFKVVGREKVVDLLQTAVAQSKLVQVNFVNDYGGQSKLVFTPTGGSQQTLNLANGVNLNR